MIWISRWLKDGWVSKFLIKSSLRAIRIAKKYKSQNNSHVAAPFVQNFAIAPIESDYGVCLDCALVRQIVDVIFFIESAIVPHVIAPMEDYNIFVFVEINGWHGAELVVPDVWPIRNPTEICNGKESWGNFKVFKRDNLGNIGF